MNCKSTLLQRVTSYQEPWELGHIFLDGVGYKKQLQRFMVGRDADDSEEFND